MKNQPRAMELIEQTINFEPREPTSHWYASLIAGSADNARALRELDLALSYGHKLISMSDLIIAASVYDSNARYNDAAILLERALTNSSKKDWPQQLVLLAHTIAIKAGRSDIRIKFEDVFPEFFKKSGV